MNRLRWAWYSLIALLLLAPIGLRVGTWLWPGRHEPDPQMVQAGNELFKHVWTKNDPLTQGGDGLGPVFNANSCVACHSQGGVGGSGGLQHNVTTFTVRPQGMNGKAREGVVHSNAISPEFQETLAHVSPGLPPISKPDLAQLLPNSKGSLNFPQGVHVSQRNTPALFGAYLIDDIPDRVIIANERAQRLKHGMMTSDTEQFPVGRALRLANGRVGKFGWKAQMSSLSDFVQAACANELGLGNPGQAQPKPLGRPDYQPKGYDLTLEQCNQLTAFVSSLPKPIERLPDNPPERSRAEAGKRVFNKVGCADCHVPNVGDAEGIYSDLLLHRMGQDLVGGGSYGEPPVPLPDFSPSDGPQPDEWRTPPLWGVADSAPYMHDGRAPTLRDAIAQHKGQAAESVRRFNTLGVQEQEQLLAFLKTLRAPEAAKIVP